MPPTIFSPVILNNHTSKYVKPILFPNFRKILFSKKEIIAL